jgi:hypothetical protein
MVFMGFFLSDGAGLRSKAASAVDR